LEAVLAAFPVAVYSTDVVGRITYYNEAAAELWGRRPLLNQDRWCGSLRLWTLDRVLVPHDECPMAVAIKENGPIRNIQALAERPDGTFVRFAPLPTPIQDTSGHLLGGINVLLDMTGFCPDSVPSQGSPDPRRLASLSPANETS